MKTLSQHTETLLSGRETNRKLTQSHQSSQSTKGQESHSDSIAQNPSQQVRLMSLLLICFDTLDTYGKEPEQLKNLEGAFRLVLGRFNIQQVEAAFAKYLEAGRVMPKPADIVQIIEPPKEKRKWCKVTFLDLKRQQRENMFITDSEKQYLADFIEASVSGDYDERSELQATIDDSSRKDKQFWIEG